MANSISALATVLTLAAALGACSDEDTSSRSSALGNLGLDEACTQFSGHLPNANASAEDYAASSAAAQDVAAHGNAEVQEFFQPIATKADAAAASLGTSAYADAEYAFYSAVHRANDACVGVNTPIFERVDES